MSSTLKSTELKNIHKGRVPDGQTLSDEDIAIVCDDGNCCFGGTVNRSGQEFTCEIWID